MIQKLKNEKNIKTKKKNSLIPINKMNINPIFNSQINSQSNSSRSENKANLKRIKNNSNPLYLDKKKGKKDNNKLKLALRNIKPINERHRTTLTKNDKILNKIRNAKTEDNLFNIGKLSKLLQNTNLKKTIIIDKEGNNNLNLIMNKNNKNSELKEKNKKEPKMDKIKEEINDDNNNSDYTSLFMESSISKNIINKYFHAKKKINNNYNTINTINNYNRVFKKNQVKSQGKENKRINEYSQIFQLLNENIEQFKNILNKKEKNISKNKEIKKKKSNNTNIDFSNKINFLSYRENNNKKIKNIKKISSNQKINKININKIHKIKDKNNIPINDIKIQNKNFKFKKDFLEEFNINNSISITKERNNSNIYSFLDSFTQDELFMPLNNKHQKKSSKSLTNIFLGEKKEENTNTNTNTKIIKKDIFSSNEMSTNKCEEEDLNSDILGTDEQIKYDKMKNRDINPHFFSNDFVNNTNNKEKKEVNNIDKDCLIF